MRYKIKTGGNPLTGATDFDLYCDGDWLETFGTRELAEEEMYNRIKFDAHWSKTHGIQQK